MRPLKYVALACLLIFSAPEALAQSGGAVIPATVPAGSTGDLQMKGVSGFAASHLNDSGSAVSSTENFNTKTNAIFWEIPNASSTGTTVNNLAKFTGAPSTAVIATTSDTVGILGIVVSGAGTTGTAQIAVSGQAACVFDGGVTSNDFVVESTTTNGNCHDAGATDPTGVAVIGNVVSNTNASAGTYQVMLYPPNVNTLGTTGNGGGGNGNIKITGSPANGNLTFWSGAKSITNGNLSGVVTTSGSGATSFQSSTALPGSPTTTTQSASDNSTKIATTAYVTTGISNAIAGVNPAVAVQAATTQASDTSGLTYNNGVSGIGATFTGSNNTALTIDGFTFTAIGQRLLVKNDTQSPSGAFNGVYYVTQVQALALPPILTRALDYDQPSDINNAGAIPVVNGTANASTTWVITSTVNTVGTDPLTYAQFSINPSNVVTTNTTQTLTASKRSTVQTLSLSSSTATPNFDNGQNFTLTLSSACPCTLANPSTTPVAGQTGVMEIIQDGSGSRTIGTWGSNYTAAGGTSTITLSTGASARDYLSYYVADSTHVVLSPAVLNATH